MRKKILVLRYRFIGDTLLTIPFLRNLRRAEPDAIIDILVSPGSGEILKDCPYINNLIYFDTTRKHKYEKGNGNKKSFWHYVSAIRKENYDKAYVLKRSMSSAFLCFMAGIKERIGYNTEFRSIFLTKTLKYNYHQHESLCYLDVLKRDDIEVKDTYLENWVTDEETKKVKQLFEQNNISESSIKAVVNVTATNEKKVWDINNFARIIEYLSNEKGVQVIYMGAPDDREIYDKIQFKEELKIKPLNLCGAVDLQDSLAILKEVDFILGNDSGTLHMASSVDTKVIGLYGPMSTEKWGALGENNILIKSNLPCVPCNLKSCHTYKACMNDISVEQVKEAINQTIKRI